MKHDPSKFIAELMLRDDAGLPARLAEQEAALRKTECLNVNVGKWVEYDLDYLFAALDLSDADFGARFPNLRHVTRREREQLTATIKKHVGGCPRCSLLQEHASEWDARIELTCRDHRRELPRAKQEADEGEDTAQEGEHRSGTALKTSPAIG